MIKHGVVHKTPADIKTMLVDSVGLLPIWNSLTPLARNEWICWATSAKKAETRARRIDIAHSKLTKGARRPCCWPGCPHR